MSPHLTKNEFVVQANEFHHDLNQLRERLKALSILTTKYSATTTNRNMRKTGLKDTDPNKK